MLKIRRNLRRKIIFIIFSLIILIIIANWYSENKLIGEFLKYFFPVIYKTFQKVAFKSKLSKGQYHYNSLFFDLASIFCEI